MRIYKTSEWVSIGHPDKVADYISEYILDRMVEQDPETRYAIEVQIKSDRVSLAGEVTSTAEVDYEKLVRQAINEIGYNKLYQARFGRENTICGDQVKVTIHLNLQSPDIAQGVNKKGWGDQGIFFGYYCGETPEGHGLDYSLARNIGSALYVEALGSKELGIDIKTQVTVSFDDNHNPDVEEVIVAIPMVSGLETAGKKKVKEIIKRFNCKDANIIINGTGAYCTHGPIADSGTTGRKLVVDFYGGRSRIGGGSPWTKDGTKADLTLNLYAHELAKEYYLNLKDAGAPVHHVEVELSCCIGRKEVLCQVMAYDAEGVVLYTSSDMTSIATEVLIDRYHLNMPVYAKMCREGLFSLFEQRSKSTKGQKN